MHKSQHTFFSVDLFWTKHRKTMQSVMTQGPFDLSRNQSMYCNDHEHCDHEHLEDNDIIQVSSDIRNQVIKSQKDAVLRRRKQQLQSGFVKSFNRQTIKSIGNDPYVVPTVRTSLRQQDSGLNIPSNVMQNNERTSIQGHYESREHEYYETRQQEKVMHGNTSVIPKRCVPDAQNIISVEYGSNIHHNRKSSAPTLNFVHDKLQGCKEKSNNDDYTDNHLDDDTSDEDSVLLNQEKNSDQLCGIIEKNVIRDSPWREIDWANAEHVKKVVMSPCPKEVGTVKCYIRRFKDGKAKMFPEYRVYLQEGDIFLMTSKKRAKKRSSNYLISVERNDYDKQSGNIVGKLRANFLGTEFQIYDSGKNPKRFDPFFDEVNKDITRSELGAVLYTSNLLGNRRPRKMQVCINRINQDGQVAKRWRPVHKDEEMIERFKHRSTTATQQLLIYENRQPKWNEDIGSFVLNFNKRVNLASVKNFQLVDPDSTDGDMTLQFGKKSEDEFIMDVQWPMSLFQAFAISLSSFDSKLACD